MLENTGGLNVILYLKDQDIKYIFFLKVLPLHFYKYQSFCVLFAQAGWCLLSLTVLSGSFFTFITED